MRAFSLLPSINKSFLRFCGAVFYGSDIFLFLHLRSEDFYSMIWETSVVFVVCVICRRPAGAGDAPRSPESATGTELSVDAQKPVRCRHTNCELPPNSSSYLPSSFFLSSFLPSFFLFYFYSSVCAMMGDGTWCCVYLVLGKLTIPLPNPYNQRSTP